VRGYDWDFCKALTGLVRDLIAVSCVSCHSTSFIREGEKMGKRIKEENCPFSAIAFFIGKGCPHFGPEGLIDYGSLCRNVDCLFFY